MSATGQLNSSGSRAADRVAESIALKISSGELPNDMPLPSERGLIEQFGVSRTVIREAISQLASRGLIEARPRFRPVVKKPDFGTVLEASGTIVRYMLNEPRGVLNLYQSRVFIERGLVRDAALNANKDTIAELKTALAANHATINDSEEFFKTDLAFHGIFFAMTGNPIFPAMHEGFCAWLSPNWSKMDRSSARNEMNYWAHRAIFEAVLERDPDRAEEALIEHLKGAWEFVKDTFDDVSP